MSDDITTIIFEHPLNEKMRSWLRIENSLIQINSFSAIDSLPTALSFFRAISEFIEVLDRGEIRAELLKELEKRQKKLQQWLSFPNVDKAIVTQIIDELAENAIVLSKAPRIGQHLKQDKVINLVKQRLSIPGGCCNFDVPALHLWLSLPQAIRDERLQSWLTGLLPLQNALNSLLMLIRQSDTFKPVLSHRGFYQDSAEEAELLRVKIAIEHQIYPQVSGHKNRYAIRFLPLDSENGTVPLDLPFEIACC
ncbi:MULTISPECIES: cell division protein ZapD [Proteus]|uniref:cell division protein ZapD n=1 Tax=Proteus TaxID=583 RepID=UPI000D6E37E2|nr:MULTISPECIES: cell division protein ZapD [Proteus]MCO8049496.1 cell division protein ZapD [Proteus penneri]NBL91137.1 cell division protein ZapD [Proteus sp. G2673]NBM04207.1 cell division protein ZapD [Proteus sp. G2671]NBM13933.1 cell division protein ZapD [Proteus sp. G2670]NBM33108.1 cell division protein ZapD [Proteus sp. G2664]